MKDLVHRIAEIQKESKQIIKDLKDGKITSVEAADKIIAAREEIERIYIKMKAGGVNQAAQDSNP
jgi:hypothetical protein